ncbi:MAG: UDP-N-acetylmuramoyl-L-alanyl-D-glutamate--2,6-diaminopimelate ligase [Pseudomonadota bacterium]|nr:UDP-N-acetylmuramoyl-L-alanyl-D-glutamate--2,6-diaminopimelate ligase [Pseudomonadota bacterium]
MLAKHLTSLNELLIQCGQSALVTDVAITGLTNHSQKVKAGDVFVAYQGAKSDGKSYLLQALKAGAVAFIVDQPLSEQTHQAIAEQRKATGQLLPVIIIAELASKLGEWANAFWCQPSQQLSVVGITGTNGKTTVSNLLAQWLEAMGQSAFIIGTLGNGFLGQLKLSANTTPDALELQALFAQCVADGVSYVVMEVSSIAVDQGRINGSAFAASVFLNLSQDHLDYHGSMAAYAEAKAQFIRHFGAIKLVNSDDELGKALLNELDQAADFGLHARDYRVATCELSTRGIEMSIRQDTQLFSLQSSLLGAFNAQNLVAAFAVLVKLGFSAERLCQSAPMLSSPKGRMQSFVGPSGVSAVIDFAHTPDALKKVLETARALTSGRIFVVVGCGGDRDRSKRPMMAKIATELADKSWFTADNPRTERVEQIINDMMAGVATPELVTIEYDRETAIRQATAALLPSDVLVIAGKGHEAYQEIDGVRHAYSDAQALKNVGFNEEVAA